MRLDRISSHGFPSFVLPGQLSRTLMVCCFCTDRSMDRRRCSEALLNHSSFSWMWQRTDTEEPEPLSLPGTRR